MSSTVSQESRVMLAELLAAEKDATRVWLRDKMDGLVDSMFHRLTHKLMMNSHLERTQSDDDSQVHHDAQFEPNQLHQSSFVIAQPSTSSHLMPPHQNVIHYSYHQQPNDNPIHCNDNSNQQSQLMISLIQPSTMSPNTNFEVPISNEPTTTNQVNHSLPTESQSAIANEQQSNTNFDDNEGECDCEDCLNAIEIDEVVEDDDDDSDSVQWIDDDQEEDESSRPVKRPRMDSTQPNDATQPEVSPRQATDEAQSNQVNNQDKQYITVHLQCPLSECPDTFLEDQLNQHMFDVHSMGPFRCLVKDCGQAFDDSAILKKHRKQSHQSTTQWHCDKCLKHFAKYKRLSDHNHLYHQLGHFQCSFPSCTFTGEYKMKIYDHYRQRHKPEFVCSQTDCNYSTYNEATLKAHERAHLGIKPYRCKWLNCHHSSSYQHHVLSHIRTQHLTSRFQRPNKIDVVAQSADPRDYLEVASELL